MLTDCTASSSKAPVPVLRILFPELILIEPAAFRVSLLATFIVGEGSTTVMSPVCPVVFGLPTVVTVTALEPSALTRVDHLRFDGEAEGMNGVEPLMFLSALVPMVISVGSRRR